MLVLRSGCQRDTQPENIEGNFFVCLFFNCFVLFACFRQSLTYYVARAGLELTHPLAFVSEFWD